MTESLSVTVPSSTDTAVEASLALYLDRMSLNHGVPVALFVAGDASEVICTDALLAADVTRVVCDTLDRWFESRWEYRAAPTWRDEYAVECRRVGPQGVLASARWEAGQLVAARTSGALAAEDVDWPEEAEALHAVWCPDLPPPKALAFVARLRRNDRDRDPVEPDPGSWETLYP